MNQQLSFLPPAPLPPGKITSGLNFRDAPYIIRSAFHKEVRRSDLTLGLGLARWFAQVIGDAELKTYCRRILLEETRNVALLVALGRREVSPMMAASMLIRSPKKWELRCRAGVYETYARAYVAAQSIARPDPKDIEEFFGRPFTLADGFRVFWRVRQERDAKLERVMSVALARRAEEAGKWAVPLARYSRTVGGFYIDKSLIEMLTGHWSEAEANLVVYEPVEEKPAEELGPLPIYAFDNHTRTGFTAYKRGLPYLRPGAHPPEKVDARWSGLLRGVYWREVAARLTPEFRGLRWEDAPMDPEVWRGTVRADRFFYQKLYDAVPMSEDGELLR